MKCKLEKDQGKLILNTLKIFGKRSDFETLKLTFCKDGLFVKDVNKQRNIQIDLSYPITIFSEPPSSEITIEVDTTYLQNAIQASNVTLPHAKGLEIELEYPNLYFATLDPSMKYMARCNAKTEPKKLESNKLEYSAKNLNIVGFEMVLKIIEVVASCDDIDVHLTLSKNKLKMLAVAESKCELSTSDVNCECGVDDEVRTAVRIEGLKLIQELASQKAERMDVYLMSQGIVLADLFYPYNARAKVTLAKALTD